MNQKDRKAYPGPLEAYHYSEYKAALVIGNGAYQEARLRNPLNDAADIAGVLRELGFETTLLLNATRMQMIEAFDAFGRKLHRGGVGLFYYAGHGVQVKGANFLIPIGANISKPLHVEFEAVNVARVLGEMEEAANRVNIVILDACRSNPYERSFRSGSRGLASIDAPRGTLIAYSTAPGQVAADGAERNSPYTGELLAQMQEAGLEIGQVFRRVRAAVMEKTAGHQVPWESTSLTGDFYFLPPEIQPQPAPEPLPAPKPPQPEKPPAQKPAQHLSTKDKPPATGEPEPQPSHPIRKYLKWAALAAALILGLWIGSQIIDGFDHARTGDVSQKTEQKPVPEENKDLFAAQFQQADQYLKEERFYQAAKVLREILGSNPNHQSAREKLIDVLEKKAEQEFRNRNYTLPESDNALKTCREILRYDPNNAFAKGILRDIETYFTNLGDAASGRGDYSRALENYRKAYGVNNNADIQDKIARLNQPPPQAPPKFRSTPRENFTEGEVKTMLAQQGFFDSGWNTTGRGFANQYEVQQNGRVVFDRAGGLMWQKSGSPNYMTYADAQKYIDQLNRERFAGFSDWRLPTLEEAMSLMEREKLNGDLYIDPLFDKTQRWIWTADRYSASSAWCVDFYFGGCFSDPVEYDVCVRAVRGG